MSTQVGRWLEPESGYEQAWNREQLGAAPEFARSRLISDTAYTLTIDDLGMMLVFTSDVDVQVTLPSSAVGQFPPDSEVVIVAGGDGDVAIVAGIGVVLESKDGTDKITNGRLGAVMIKRLGYENSFWLFGDYA